MRQLRPICHASVENSHSSLTALAAEMTVHAALVDEQSPPDHHPSPSLVTAHEEILVNAEKYDCQLIIMMWNPSSSQDFDAIGTATPELEFQRAYTLSPYLTTLIIRRGSDEAARRRNSANPPGIIRVSANTGNRVNETVNPSDREAHLVLPILRR